MTKTFIWTKSNQSKLISSDGHISIYQDKSDWILDDGIEREIIIFTTKKEALDEAAYRMMISELGNFLPFIKDLDLVFDHQIQSF